MLTYIAQTQSTSALIGLAKGIRALYFSESPGRALRSWHVIGSTMIMVKIHMYSHEGSMPVIWTCNIYIYIYIYIHTYTHTYIHTYIHTHTHTHTHIYIYMYSRKDLIPVIWICNIYTHTHTHAHTHTHTHTHTKKTQKKQ